MFAKMQLRCSFSRRVSSVGTKNCGGEKEASQTKAGKKKESLNVIPTSNFCPPGFNGESKKFERDKNLKKMQFCSKNKF